MSRRGGKGMSGQQPRAGFYEAPRWGDRAIGKRAGTPPRSRLKDGLPAGPQSRAQDGVADRKCRPAPSVAPERRVGGCDRDVAVAARVAAGVRDGDQGTQSISPGSYELPGDGKSEEVITTTV